MKTTREPKPACKMSLNGIAKRIARRLDDGWTRSEVTEWMNERGIYGTCSRFIRLWLAL